MDGFSLHWRSAPLRYGSYRAAESGNYGSESLGINPASGDVDIAVLQTGETIAQPFQVAVSSPDEGPTMGQHSSLLFKRNNDTSGHD
jgi:hypothetical protein